MHKIFFLFLLAIMACGKPEITGPLVYEGPLRQGEKVELYYSENERVKVKMSADLLNEFQNGDQEYPKGIYLEFYNEFGRLNSTLRANYAYFYKKDNKWKGQGDVEVKNTEKNEQLNTEELFWMPATKKIFTESFVTIRQQSDVIYGQGLEALEDLSDYKIKNPTGELSVEE
ncbi:MAG: LPS export ABC transporter periplasmic protein LptC [Flammeovirgaceae bacterium]|nr:LPS export ABC transporter periplasmic protein LptC [Flammeovirgaceae bacterium]